MKILAVTALGAVFSLPLLADTIVIDTRSQRFLTPSIKVGSLPFNFPDENGDSTLHDVRRLDDGTVEITIKGDFVLEANDVLRGIGSFPVVLRVGNDAYISPDAVIDFSAINLQPGAGGGAAFEGGVGGIGGQGGPGGRGGEGGRRGSGGLNFTPQASAISITSPGIPAGDGTSGANGKKGDDGLAGTPGRDGLPGFSNSLASTGLLGGEGERFGAILKGANSGLSGEALSYPPPIYFQGGALRSFLYKTGESHSHFIQDFYSGGSGAAGNDATDYEQHDIDAHPAGIGQDATAATHPASLWTLSGGSSGGSGGGGAGGAGGTGGGGGGGGAGGHGEWPEPVPTGFLTSDIFEAALGVAAAINDEAIQLGIEKVISKVIQAYIKNGDFDIALIPVLDYGATGGSGGDGGQGGYGGYGGMGGTGGSGGAGGGALLLEAQGRIFLQGKIEANGFDGMTGSAGQAAPNVTGTFLLGETLDDRLRGFGMSTVLSPVSALLDLLEDPRSGLGGSGGDGGLGGKGAPGFPGGSGAGGSAGTIILSSSSLLNPGGTGSIEVAGGESPDPDNQPELAGEDGRIFIGSNALPDSSDTATILAGKNITLEGAIPTAATRMGPQAVNPFIAGKPLTPTISELRDGAESFGLLTELANDTSFTVNGVSLRDNAPAGGEQVICAMRLDQGPAPYDEDYHGHDMVLVFNFTNQPLTEVRFGAAPQTLPLTLISNPNFPGTDENGNPEPEFIPDPDTLSPYQSVPLTQGGFSRDPSFGGSGDIVTPNLSSYEVFALLIPEDTATVGHNFAITASNGEATFRFEDPHFENGEVICAVGNPNVPVYIAEWNPTNNTNNPNSPDGNWNDADNWNTISPPGEADRDDVIPNNVIEVAAYDVGINLADADITQDTSITIDRLRIGSSNTLTIQNDFELLLKKFDVRANGGLVENSGIIHLDSTDLTSPPTALKFQGQSLSLSGTGFLTTSKNPNNLIGSDLSLDSFIQESDHSLIASGMFGDNSLNFTNFGLVQSNSGDADNDRQAFIVDPSHTSTHHSAPFVNEASGSLLVGSEFSELHLTDGYYQNLAGGLIGFEAPGSALDNRQTLLLQNLRLHGGDETIAAAHEGQLIHITGNNTLENLELTATNDGVLLLDNTDLTLRDVTLRVDNSEDFTDWTSSSPAVTFQEPARISDSTITGGTLSFVDPGGLFTCDNPSPFAFGHGNDVRFHYDFAGNLVTLENVTLDGSYCYDHAAILHNDYGTDYIGSVFPDGIPESNAYVTSLVNSTQLGLEGTLNNNGLVRLFGTEVLIGEQTILDGSGSFTGNGFFQTDGSNTSFLSIGASQHLFGSTFLGNGLEVENNGQLFDVSWDYDSAPAGAPTETGALLAFLRSPILGTNNGYLEPTGTFGGGVMDNTNGVIGWDDDIPNFENVHIDGGRIILDHYRGDNWLEYELSDLFSQTATAFNTKFSNLTFEAPNFVPDPGDGSLLLNDELNGAEQQARHLGLLSISPADLEKDLLDIPATNIELSNVRLATHVDIGSPELSQALTIDSGVFAHFNGTTINGNTTLIPNQTDPNTTFAAAISFTGGLGGTSPGFFRLPSGLTCFGDGNWGNNTLAIENNGVILYDLPDVYLHFGFFPENDLILDAPGDANSPVGFINRGTIRPAIDSYNQGFLRINPGHYDNTEGTITYLADFNFSNHLIDGALIDGGVINDLNGEFADPPSVTLINGSTLRNLNLKGINLLGDSSNVLENVTVLPPSLLAGTFTVVGDLTYDSPSASFTLDDVPTFTTATDRLVLSAGTSITFTAASQPLTSIKNSGSLNTESDLTLSTPTTPTGETLSLDTLVGNPNAPLGTLTSLADLGFTNPVELVSSSTIQNAGSISVDGVLNITQATLDNEGGDIAALDNLLVSQSLIQNLDGSLYSGGIAEFSNSIVFNGTLSADSVSIVDGGLGTEALTSFQDLTITDTGSGIGTVLHNYSSLALVGDIDAANTQWNNWVELLVAGEESLVTLTSLYNSGTLTLGESTLEASAFFDSEGLIEGSGTINSPLIDVQDILSPGLSAGTINLNGSVLFFPSTTFEIELGGLEPGTGHDRINVDSPTSLTLDGTLEVSIIDDFGLCYDDTFTILTSTSTLTGDFAGIQSGDRIPVATGGDIAVYYGSSSPHNPNHVVLTEYIANPNPFPSSPYSANFEVIQNAPGNLTTDITLNVLPGSSSGISHNTSLSNRGDYSPTYPAGINTLADGVVIPSISQTLRNNAGIVDYPTIGIFDDFGTYYLSTTRRGGGFEEFNTNFAISYFRYDEWLAGYAENNAGNNTNIDTLTASTGITLGSELTQIAAGHFNLDLSAFNASRDDGILLTTAVRNDDNVTAVSPKSDGSFDVFVLDNSTTSPTLYENDPFAFAYIPFDAVNRSPLVAAARIEGDGDTHRGSTNFNGDDNFSIIKTGNNTYRLSIPGHTPETGVLLVNSQGGTTSLRDNYVSYTPSSDHWVITSHSVPGTNDGNLNGAGFVFSFAFFSPTNPLQVTTCFNEDDAIATDGTGVSLREAIRDSAPGSTITFAPTLAGQTMQITNGQILIDKDLTLDGSSAASGISISGTNTSRLFHVSANNTLTLDSLTLRDGNATGDGGALLVDGHLILNRVSLISNSCSGNGGAIAVVNGGSLFARNSTLAYNSAPTGSGGALSLNPTPGAGYFDGAFLTIAYNSANNGGAAHTTTDQALLYESIVAHNTAPTNPSFYEQDLDPEDEFDSYFDFDGLKFEEGDNEANNPRFLPLDNYGGLTPTLHIAPSSPAVGLNGGFAFRNTDQRNITQGIEDETIGATLIGGYEDLTPVWLNDADNDGLSLGLELVFGTNPSVADHDDPRHGPQVFANELGQPTVSFSLQGGLYRDEFSTQYTIVRLMRSTNLVEWQEIFRRDEIEGDLTQPGYSVQQNFGTGQLSITELASPSTEKAFYRIEALLFENVPE